ncbi:MAG: hypothetical protein RLZZ68_566 [Bacteroidota bacterium]|jgi:hypothetical protein
MKIIGIMLLLVALPVFSQNGKIPYFVPSSQKPDFNHVYLIKDSDETLVFLRFINDHRCEKITYYLKPDKELATRIEATYSFNKKNQLIVYEGVKQSIIRSDSLVFAVEDAHPTALENPFSSYYFRDFKFYDKRVKSWLKYQPIITESNDKRLTHSWTQSPITGESLVTGPCTSPTNLNCLCAALTYDKTSFQEKADAIGEFVIDRFDYNRGDTAQTNIHGLIFGKEREAVCEGYSRVYKDLMQRLNFKTDYMSGAVRTDVYDIFYSGHSHAWNQTMIQGKTYSLDITWAKNLKDQWYLMEPNDFQISHFDLNENSKINNAGDSNMTMYDFMHQPLINPIMDGGFFNSKAIDKTVPFQIAQGTFTLNFNRTMMVNRVIRQELSYPFVKFSGENGQVASNIIAKSGAVSKKAFTNRLEIQLPEKINNIEIEIEGIGTLHYVVFNGTIEAFYQYLIDHKNPASPHSMALAFLACAKLNDPNVFNSLKAHVGEGINFKSFMKQARKFNIDDFTFSTFNGSHHQSYTWDANSKLVAKRPKKNQHGKFENFIGYSFEYSKPHEKQTSKIYLNENEDSTYSFYKFDVNSW